MRNHKERAESVAQALNRTGKVRARVYSGRAESVLYITREWHSNPCQRVGFITFDVNGMEEHIREGVRGRTVWIRRIAQGEAW